LLYLVGNLVDRLKWNEVSSLNDCANLKLTEERHCAATFSADAAMLHKVVLYAEDLVHESYFWGIRCT